MRVQCKLKAGDLIYIQKKSLFGIGKYAIAFNQSNIFLEENGAYKIVPFSDYYTQKYAILVLRDVGVGWDRRIKCAEKMRQLAVTKTQTMKRIKLFLKGFIKKNTMPLKIYLELIKGGKKNVTTEVILNIGFQNNRKNEG